MKNIIRRFNYTLWLLMLLVWSVPVGYMFTIMTQPKIMFEDNIFIIIVGGITMILGLGGFSYLVFRISKKMGSNKSFRNSLIFYTIFLLIFLAISYFGTNSGEKRVKRDTFIGNFVGK